VSAPERESSLAKQARTRAEITDGLRALLLARSVPLDEIDAAIAENRLDLLVIDRLLLPTSHLRTPEQVIETTGIPLEIAERLWRALGFPEVGEGNPAFTDQDIEALRTIQGLTELGLTTGETSVQVTRVLGSSMSRVADAFMSATDQANGIVDYPMTLACETDPRLEEAMRVAFASEVVLPSMERLLIYAWRRHIQAAARRRATMLRDHTDANPMLPVLTVGFADMVGFTALSSQLDAESLMRVVDRFEALAHDTVVEGGGRVVKMIGDEAMFVTTDATNAVRIALDLVDAYADDDVLSDVRVGLATGPVLAREGDFFGAVVNRASRIVNIADAGSVLVSAEARDAIIAECERSGGEELAWQSLKPRELKDLGRVELWTVARPGRTGPSEERRAGVRWRRMTGITHQLSELRQTGEAAISSLRSGDSSRVDGAAS
jgi:adenylate cyclase